MVIPSEARDLGRAYPVLEDGTADGGQKDRLDKSSRPVADRMRGNVQPSVTILVKVLPHGDGLPLPKYASEGAAGCDLHAAIDGPLTLAPGERAAVPTGLVLAIPEGFEGQVRARSGLALRSGIVCVNAPGTIDSDYRGEVKVILGNFGSEAVEIRRGERIAQLIVAPVARAAFSAAAELPETRRGGGGFGSTGS